MNRGPNGRLGVALVAALAVIATSATTDRAASADDGTAARSPSDASPVTDTPLTDTPLTDIAVPVEMVTDGVAGTDPATAAADVAAVGGEVIATTPTGLVTARVPLADLARLRERTAAYVRSPVHLDIRPQRTQATGASTGVHVDVTAADDWHTTGFTGAGIRIGVIDFFNVPAHWDTDEMGPEPVPNVSARCIDIGSDCVSDLYDETAEVGDDHGPAVVEVIRDMAPDAEIYIGRATTESDYYELVDWFAANGVRIVNRSLGSRYDGPGDGRGALTSLADYAVGRGITWFNSAGNSGTDRYYRQPARVVGDAIAFGPSGTDTWLPFNGCIALGGVRWANDWDLPPAQRTDYDAFVVQAPTGNPAAGQTIAASTARQTAGAPPLETFGGGSACPADGTRFYLRVELVSGDPTGDVIEVLDYGDGMGAHTQAPFSAAAPVVDSRNAGVVAVGAVDPPASGTIGSYSSRGPTNDGRVKPDVVAASGADSVTFGAAFSGTSASAPVVAGGAALLLQAGLAADARSLGDLVRHSVVDRGPEGRDNAYGTGEFLLPAPPTDVAEPAPSRYVPLDAPTRVLDTRPASAIGPSALIGDPWSGRIVDLPVDAIPGVGDGGTDPGAVTAVAANVTVVDAGRPGFTQALPTARATLAGFSNSNLDTAGQTRPNLMIVPVGLDTNFSVYDTAGGHLLVDVLGTFTATDGPVTGGRFVDLPAARRVLDSRTDGPPIGTGETASFGVPDTVERDQVAALVVNVTATRTAGQGFVQAVPAGRDDEVGRTSTLNLTDGATVANTVIVPVGADDGTVSLFVELGPGGATHLIADVTGYITSGAAPSSTTGRFVPVRPGRAFDSRALGGPLPSGATADVRATDVADVDLPATTSAIVWNFAVTGTTRPGFLAGWPADASDPGTSSLNWTLPDTTVANGGIAAASDDGVMRIRVDGGPLVAGAPLAHVVVDMFGYFT